MVPVFTVQLGCCVTVAVGIFGAGLITTLAVSLQPDELVQIYLYVPMALKPVIVVFAKEAFVIVDAPGFPGAADQILPAPAVAFMVTVPARHVVLSRPAWPIQRGMVHVNELTKSSFDVLIPLV